ncbi:GNAT family N-acetyltransferase [Streptomyces sp. NPDC005483]|uniref:GNAT family N-acetyltransferase n=1 Tax=Streptomyces sp. NPDC005483 TaxID=3154882 RepID=UPI00339E1FCE
MLDNNVWSYLGDARAGSRFKTVAHALGHRVVTAPSVLLGVLQHPHSDMRAAIIEAITTATDERLRSEADREGAEVVSEVHRLHPEWMRAMPHTGREATWRTYWTKRFWREAAEHHDRLRDAEPARRTARTARFLVDGEGRAGHPGEQAWIYNIAVAAAERRSGLGRALLTEVARQAQEAGRTFLALAPQDGDDVPSRRTFFQACGLRMIESETPGAAWGCPVTDVLRGL